MENILISAEKKMFNIFSKPIKHNILLPEWYDLAYKEIGTKEVPGRASNPEIIKYHQATTLMATDDSVPWCAAFVCWCLESSGIKSTRSAAARSFLYWGKEIAFKNMMIGDLIIFKRGNSSWQGHVAFYTGDSFEKYIPVLGGNQNDSVNIAKYPIEKIIGIRRPNE